jgi:putative acetyltransferase
MITTNQPPQITIQPFQPQDQAAVKDLVLSGLADHWGVLDPAKNPDLDDIAHSYAKGIFLVAWLENRIVGTGALIPRADDTAEIVRMSVARELRRRSLGRQILDRLCAEARLLGCTRVILETTATWSDVIEFYKRYGFQITHTQDGDVYFSLDL